jgi:hypothetical protein
MSKIVQFPGEFITEEDRERDRWVAGKSGGWGLIPPFTVLGARALDQHPLPFASRHPQAAQGRVHGGASAQRCHDLGSISDGRVAAIAARG